MPEFGYSAVSTGSGVASIRDWPAGDPRANSWNNRIPSYTTPVLPTAIPAHALLGQTRWCLWSVMGAGGGAEKEVDNKWSLAVNVFFFQMSLVSTSGCYASAEHSPSICWMSTSCPHRFIFPLIRSISSPLLPALQLRWELSDNLAANHYDVIIHRVAVGINRLGNLVWHTVLLAWSWSLNIHGLVLMVLQADATLVKLKS